MFCQQDQAIGAGTVSVLQRELNIVLEATGAPERLTVDDDYGNKTAGAMMRTGVGNPANSGSVYFEAEYSKLQNKLRDIAAMRAVAAHLNGDPHGTVDAFSFVIPAQEITVTPSED
jgi:hypothetical protein